MAAIALVRRAKFSRLRGRGQLSTAAVLAGSSPGSFWPRGGSRLGLACDRRCVRRHGRLLAGLQDGVLDRCRRHRHFGKPPRLFGRFGLRRGRIGSELGAVGKVVDEGSARRARSSDQHQRRRATGEPSDAGTFQPSRLHWKYAFRHAGRASHRGHFHNRYSTRGSPSEVYLRRLWPDSGNPAA